MRAAIYSALPYPYGRGVSACAIYHGKLKAAVLCAFSAAFNFFLPFPSSTNAAARTYAPAVGGGFSLLGLFFLGGAFPRAHSPLSLRHTKFPRVSCAFFQKRLVIAPQYMV